LLQVGSLALHYAARNHLNIFIVSLTSNFTELEELRVVVNQQNKVWQPMPCCLGTG
jgi:hypothetical protein